MKSKSRGGYFPVYWSVFTSHKSKIRICKNPDAKEHFISRATVSVPE